MKRAKKKKLLPKRTWPWGHYVFNGQRYDKPRPDEFAPVMLDH